MGELASQYRGCGSYQAILLEQETQGLPSILAFELTPLVGLQYVIIGQFEKGLVPQVSLRYLSYSHFAAILIWLAKRRAESPR
jgi:hypothetical protein